MDEFELYLVSNGSMDLFPDNSLAAFTNHLAEPIHLEGNWGVALTDITFPAMMKNVSKTSFYSTELRSEPDNEGVIRHSYVLKTPTMTLEAGFYENVDQLLAKIKNLLGMSLVWTVNQAGILTFSMENGNGITFHDRTIPDILGFKAKKVKEGWYVGHQQLFEFMPHTDSERTDSFEITGDYAVDLLGGRHLIFVYLSIIEYQLVGDSKSPLLKIIPIEFSEYRGSIAAKGVQVNHRFSNFDVKTLMSGSIQSIKAELRSDSGELIPFFARGRTALTLKFCKRS